VKLSLLLLTFVFSAAAVWAESGVNMKVSSNDVESLLNEKPEKESDPIFYEDEKVTVSLKDGDPNVGMPF
jgi:hypothetical protein